jgi:hypothetical protein
VIFIWVSSQVNTQSLNYPWYLTQSSAQVQEIETTGELHMHHDLKKQALMALGFLSLGAVYCLKPVAFADGVTT